MKKASILLLPILLCAAPNKPSNITLSPTSNSVTISWHDNSNDERGFKIFRNGKFIALVAPNKTSFIDRGLRANKNYRYEVRATDDNENLVNSISAISNNSLLTLTIEGRLKMDSHASFFIDADNNPNTGYSRGTMVGIDYLVDGRNFYSYGGVIDGHKWNWNRVSTISKYELTSTKATFEVPLNEMNLGTNIKYIAEVASSDWSKKTDYSVMNQLSVSGTKNLPIIIVGPSTVYIEHESNTARKKVNGLLADDCRLEGWGERLYEYANVPNSVYNYARPGSNHNSFQRDVEEDIDYKISIGSIADSQNDKALTRFLFGPKRDHYWAKTKERMRALGEGIILIQFGGSNEDPSSDNKSKFRENLKLYIDESRALGFTPVFITDIEKRIKDDNNHLVKSRRGYPAWMKEVAAQEGVRVLDLNKKSYQEYDRLSEAQWDEKFGECYNQWSKRKEKTHLEVKGARLVASWIRDLACSDRSSKLCKQLTSTPKNITLTSPNFIPSHGSPAFSWSNIPPNTESFAIIIDDDNSHDADGRDWIHWSVLNINKNIRSINAGTTPAGAKIELNSNGGIGYSDPAFPNQHKYVAHIYALDVKDLTKTGHYDGPKVYKPNYKYDHKEFEKIFGNYILKKGEVSSK
jgi:phosphatidylethanolamine-binding protein (PEBP) family uncharacterized protein